MEVVMMTNVITETVKCHKCGHQMDVSVDKGRAFSIFPPALGGDSVKELVECPLCGYMFEVTFDVRPLKSDE
jgi:transcription elongation factor Elf1